MRTYIMAKVYTLYHWQFRILLDKMESTHPDFLLYNRAPWMLRGEELKCFAACLGEVNTFIRSKGIIFPELEPARVAGKASFYCPHDSEPEYAEKTFQGKEGIALHILEEVLVLERKLTVSATDIQKGTQCLLTSLRKYKQCSQSD